MKVIHINHKCIKRRLNFYFTEVHFRIIPYFYDFITNPTIKRITPKTNDVSISLPRPFPLAKRTKKPFVSAGPKAKTTTRFIMNNNQCQSITLAQAITAKINPLIQWIADINGLETYMG